MTFPSRYHIEVDHEIDATKAPIAVDTSKARVGMPAPDFRLKSTSGATVTLSALRGHPVVIVFFASWCHPCEEELPVLQQFADAEALRDRPRDDLVGGQGRTAWPCSRRRNSSRRVGGAGGSACWSQWGPPRRLSPSH